MKWWIGCSGFHYKHWKGTFYPEDLPQKKWFGFYRQQFNSLELNVTFYSFPKPAFVEAWYSQAPEHFSFAVKAPKAITHFKQFINTEQMLADFYGTIKEGLKEKLGCVLFQLPPRMKYKEKKLEQIIEAMDPSCNNVLEFRHESWWNAEVYKKLAKRDITFCSMSHPALPDDVIQNTKTVYYRFHGVPQLYWSEYEKTFLKRVVDEITGNKKVKQAFIYFNNDAASAAFKNAREIETIVKATKK